MTSRATMSKPKRITPLVSFTRKEWDACPLVISLSRKSPRCDEFTQNPNRTNRGLCENRRREEKQC